MKIDRDNARFIILIVWMVLNTYLVVNGHVQLNSDVLRLDQLAAQQVISCRGALK